MQRKLKNFFSGLLLATMVVIGLNEGITANATNTVFCDSNVIIVDSVENEKYPSTTTEYTVKDVKTTKAFMIETSTIIKAYFSWDASSASKITVWFATDYDGINVIGKKHSLNESGQTITVALDPGTYYLCFTADTVKSVEYTMLNFAILGEKIESTESVLQSSKNKPNDLKISSNKLKVTNKGFLSATNPVDYYKFILSEETDLSFDFNFKNYEGIDIKSGVMKIYDYETDSIIVSKGFNATNSSSNMVNIKLKAGTYYITMSGATTSTALTATILGLDSSFEDDEQNQTEINQKKPIPIDVTYVDYIDNYQYPETSKYAILSETVGVKSFKITKPTIVKIYMTWDTSAFRSATVWLSRDSSGYDVIKSENKLSKTTSYIYHLLDPGTYYVNYKMTGTSKEAKAKTGVCIIGEKVSTNEGSNYASSYKKPVTLTLNKTYKGFLSVTAPIDYYKLILDEKSFVTFTFDFAQRNGNKNNGAKITIYDKNNVILQSQMYSASATDRNKISAILGKGTYYISMAGSETSTVLKASVASRTIVSKKITSGNVVKIALETDFDVDEIKVIKGYVNNELITNNTKWSKSSKVENFTYTATSNGYYTFRVKDVYGNYFLKRVKIDTIK